MTQPGVRNQESGRAKYASAGEWESGFRRVIAWQKADDLFAAIYRLADSIPKRDYWLTSQLLGAARSVSSNIAEGHERGTIRDYVRFLEMAISSLNEVENDLHLLTRNGIVAVDLIDPVEPIRIETGKVLTGLLRAMRSKLMSNGDWQRRQVSEEKGIYRADWDLEIEVDDVDLLAPGSWR
jgi:four helix bundle protein